MGHSFAKEVPIVTAEKGKLKTKEETQIWNFSKPEIVEIEDIKTPFDGVGIISPDYAKYINESLNIDGASSFQVRMPFVKGMLHCVDFKGFLSEKDAEGMEQDVYEYEDAKIKVTATLERADAVPDDAYFAVTPLTAGSGYNVDAFIDALNAQAEMPDGADDFEYNTTNTLLYDVAFYTDESMTEEIEPADGRVRTEIVFLQNQLKDELSAGEESDLIINHLSIDDSLLEAVLSNKEVKKVFTDMIKTGLKK